MSKQQINNYDIAVLQHYDNLEKWDDLVDLSPQGTLFCKSWWLRAVCQENFEIPVIKRAEILVAGLPIPYTVKGAKKIVRMPYPTQALGPVLRTNNCKKY